MKFLSDVKTFTPEQITELDEITLKDLLLRYTDNEVIHSFVSRVGSVYCAIPSWELAAGEFVRCLSWEASARSSGYPDGGCVSITNVFIDGIKKLGGELINSAPVDKIIVENGKAVGVTAGGKVYKADMIVSNADIKHTILNLAGSEHFDTEYVEYVKNLKYSYGATIVRIALDKPITDIKMLGQVGEICQEQYYDKIRKNIMPEQLNLFLVVPSNFSPTVAPEGKQLVMVASPIPTDVSEEMVNKLQEAMLDTVEKYMPELRQHIMWTDFTSMKGMKSIGGEEGCVIGIAQSPGQVGKNRPKKNTARRL